jgi:nicotinamide mononucleotide transporter
MKALEKYNISNTDVIVMIVLVLLQALTAIWAKDNMVSFISGMTGIISVVLCSQKKISFYLFGFIQLFTYCYLCIGQHLWGEVIENVFYFVTMIVGIVVWIKNYNKEKYEVVPKKLSEDWKLTCLLVFLLGTILVWIILLMTNDTHPFLDSVSTVPAFIAQILMIAGYKDQWKYWIIVDISSIVMWAIIGNPFMVMQFSLWTINCLYGMHKWNKS